MAEAVNIKCPSCGAPLQFDGNSQEMTCQFCGSKFTVDQINEAQAAEKILNEQSQFHWTDGEREDISGELTGMAAGVCPSCGAEIVGDANTAATSCPYCGNSIVISASVTGMYKPDMIIPFKLDKEAAKAALKKFYGGKKLLPKAFSDANHIEEIKGVYVPFWLFDCDADANVNYDATNVSNWSDGDFNYTKTDHFSVTRSGSLGFDEIPVDGSSRMDDNYMDSIEPFDYTQAVPFQASFLSGFMADKYDVDSAASTPRANDRVKNSTEDVFRSTVNGYMAVVPKGSTVNIRQGKVHYALFPVWMLTTKYNGKNYTFAMNGQTGKLVGELPIDKNKYRTWYGLLFAGIYAAGILLAKLLGLI